MTTPAESAAAPVLTLKQHNLVRRALPVVDECASKVCWRYELYGRPERRHVHHGRSGDCVGFSDLCTVGKLALYECAPNFQEERNRSFARYARYRVFGAMMNEVKVLTRQARIDRQILRALANHMADYNDDFNILVHDKPEMQRRVDAMCDAAAAVMFVVAAEQERAETEANGVDHREEQSLAVEALRTIVAELPEESRRLLDLLFSYGFDQAKAGEAMGAARETVNRRLARLIADLKRLLKSFGITRPTSLAGVDYAPVLADPPEEGGHHDRA